MNTLISDEPSIEIVDNIIEKFYTALNNPVRSFPESDELENLIATFEPNVEENHNDHIIDIIEAIISNSQKSGNSHEPCFEETISTASSVCELKEKPCFFSSWWSRVRNRKSYDEIESIPSINSANDDQSADESVLEEAKKQTKDLEAQGPAGLVHISALSNVINKRILVWTSSTTLCHDIGKNKPGEPLNVQYHSHPEEINGHWTLLGNNDPDVDADLNDCLFAAISAQTGHQPSELRAATIEIMKKNIRSLANRIQELATKEKCGKIILMVGGARYHGRSADAAKNVIDNSQYGRSHPGHDQGHPRGHASNPSAQGRTESAENYSLGSWKTAFLSRNDQDVVGHLALSTGTAQAAMDRLNDGYTRQVVNVSASEITQPLPQGAHFNDGRMGRVENIRQLVLVLQHHAGHHRDPNHDVFVHTFYPRLG